MFNNEFPRMSVLSLAVAGALSAGAVAPVLAQGMVL